jgi:hypothetical protein
MGLADLQKMCVDLALIADGIDQLGKFVRSYRNLIHPGLQAREQVTVDEEHARIALLTVQVIAKDAAKRHK